MLENCVIFSIASRNINTHSILINGSDKMTYNDTLNYIHSLGNFGMAPGLDRIKAVLEKLGNPQNKLKAIHIAGTNGKGSVSAMLSNVFKSAGCKTGLFISPYIIDFRERIQINGEYISENDLSLYAERVINTDIKLIEFEFITALAFLYFADKNIDILICETGLGGRLDATNTLDNLICAVITKIGLDHTAILGDTIEKITSEKCGILRDSPVVTSPTQRTEALNVIKKHTDSLIVPDLCDCEILKSDIKGNTFIYKGEKFETSLSGTYQIENAVTVIETVRSSGWQIPYNILYKGIKETFFPARLEVVCESPLIVIDGAHNPDGAAVLANELKKMSDVTAIIGVMKDKNYAEVLKRTLPYCKNAVAVTVENLPRSLSAEDLKTAAEEFCHCVVADNYTDAITKAKEISDKNPIFVFGSLYLAADIRKIIKK